MNVAFVNENTMGHSSYLLPFANEFRKNPDFGVNPHVINATPLPEPLEKRANFSVRGLRKWGLDFHIARWRMTVSRYVLEQLQRLHATNPLDVVVVNTQSVALSLQDFAARVPLFICLDATFEQLSASPWFAPNLASRLALPMTIASLRKRERKLFARAHRLLAWSEPVRQSLLRDYRCAPQKVSVLPPSVDLGACSGGLHGNERPQILFVGGDFRRKGGAVLLDCYSRWFQDRCDLHLITQSPIEPRPGICVHRDVKPYTEAWYERWQQADVFVFPSTLETFGIVLLEALAFQVPVISSAAGAARSILADGKAGWILDDERPETLAAALREVLDSPAEAQRRTSAGRQQVARHFDLSQNTELLAAWLHESAGSRLPIAAVSREALH